MPSYTASDTRPFTGEVVTGVFNTETGTITYTVTTTQGKTAVITTPISAPVPTAQLIDALQAIGQTGGVVIGPLLQTVKFNAELQSREAAAAATATNTSVPENPQPPPPVAATPGVVNPPAEPPINGLDLPPTPPINGLDLPPPPDTPINGLDLPPEPEEFGNLEQAIERQQASEPVLSEDGEAATGIRRNTETGEIFYTDPPKGNEEAFDEFAGVDEAVAQQKQIAINTSGQPVLAEDGSVAQGVAINPETGETYYTQQSLAGPTGTSAPKTSAQTEATQQDQVNFAQFEDWRVRLSLAPNIKALYKVDGDPGILRPLVATNGILFPYVPNISVQYSAHYDAADIAHSNYKIYQYKNSSVDTVNITCDFTAQDTFEANYLLAVIHFLRSVTKMFYARDNNPKAGTPPPLCYLTGLGSFQFDNHPLALTNFTYNLPIDVDYIRAGTETTLAGVNKSPQNVPNNSLNNTSGRMTGIGPGGVKPPPKFRGTPGGTIEPTYVPTKMQIQITAYPIVTRNDISNNFSLKDYATGQLLRGMKGNKRISGGIW